MPACAEFGRDEGREHLVEQQLQRLSDCRQANQASCTALLSPAVELDLVVDLIPIRAVVRDCSLDQAEGDPEVFGRVTLIAVAASDDRNRLQTSSGFWRRGDGRVLVEEAGSADGRLIAAFLDVTLGKRARRDAAATRSGAEPVEGRLR